MKNKKSSDYLSDLEKRTIIIPIVINANPIRICAPVLTIPRRTICQVRVSSPAIPLTYQATNDNIPKPIKKITTPKLRIIIFLMIISNVNCYVSINIFGTY